MLYSHPSPGYEARGPASGSPDQSRSEALCTGSQLVLPSPSSLLHPLSPRPAPSQGVLETGVPSTLRNLLCPGCLCDGVPAIAAGWPHFSGLSFPICEWGCPEDEPRTGKYLAHNIYSYFLLLVDIHHAHQELMLTGHARVHRLLTPLHSVEEVCSFPRSRWPRLMGSPGL